MIDPKLIAFYFPQFHAIPENDKWWGKGFNDWMLVEKAKPLFKGHEMPRTPLYGTYNPCDKETLVKQAKMAKDYGVFGFMFYHYWFDGKLLLQKPLEVFLENKDIDINFCVCWANETWTRAWTGTREVLIEQKHTQDPSIWEAHFKYLLPFFKDPRAIKKNGKPVFLIYRPALLKGTKKMFDFWQKLAKENGLEGLYIIAVKGYDFSNNTNFLEYYDGIMNFQPREVYNAPSFKGNKTSKFQFLRLLPPKLWNMVSDIYFKYRGRTIIDGSKIWDAILGKACKEEFPQYHLDVYESGFSEWDNTPRYNNKAKIFTRPPRENLESYISELYRIASENDSEFVFWNAWNEWSESSYLEPDTKRGFENLEIIKEVFHKKTKQ